MRPLLRVTAGVALVAAVLVFGTGTAGAQAFHGISFAKTCVDPTVVGAAYNCSFAISNFDSGHNPEVVFSLTDVVSAAPPTGSVPSGELLPTLNLFVSPTSGAAMPTCTGPSITGDGVSTPYHGATSCTLPDLNSTISSTNFSFYNVQAADYGLPGHQLTDTGSLGWNDLCTVDPVGCSTGNQTATAPGKTQVIFRPSIATSVNGTGATSISLGGTAFDTATLTTASPDAGGTVTYALYTDSQCTQPAGSQPNPATVTVTNGSVPQSGAVTFPSAGSFWWQATYSGDPNNVVPQGGLKSDCASEPLTVVPPQGQITPTNTSCQDFSSGTAQTLSQVNYSARGGVIGQGINPGVFFFYSTIETTTPFQVVTVGQSNDSTNSAALFGILNGQAWLWQGDCSTKAVGTVTGPNGSGASFTVPIPGKYIISLKYQTKSIAGTTAPVPPDVTYSWTTSLGGNTGASVLLKKE